MDEKLTRVGGLVISLAAGVALWAAFGRRDVKPGETERRTLSAEIALANRTLCATGFPARFCERQTASVRRTAPYVVMLAKDASKSEAIKAAVSCGARVIGPLPPKALLVESSSSTLGKLSADPHFMAAAEWLPEDKIDTRLKSLLETEVAALDVTVVALAPADVGLLAELAAQKGGARMKGCLNGKDTVTLHLPRTQIFALAMRGDVRWLEPFMRPKLLNDLAVGPTAMNARPVWDTHGLTGSGQLLTTSDTGIDTGDLATIHGDLRNRIAGFGVVDGCSDHDENGHGTHTAGSIVADGTMSGGQIRGTAHGAKLWAWFCDGTDGYIYMPDDCAELFRPSGAASACVHSASWGDEYGDGSYSAESASIDAYVWEHPDFLPVFANGNDGPSAMTVGAPATAKNVLSVGATQNARKGHDGYRSNGDPAKVTSFSSRGPCADGRIKPDVCAPGAGVVSTRVTALPDSAYGYGVYSNSAYAYMSGTSMATPLAAGAAAVVREWLVERRGFTNAVPTAALVKAILTGGAKNVAMPDRNFGWGCIDLGESLYPSNRAVRVVDRVPFFEGVDNLACEVTLTNAAPFDVQLVWIDYAATAGAAKTLVNDLDLVVSNKTTGAVWYGNGISGGDHTNTVESVRIAKAAEGDYAVFVRGHDISYDSTVGGAAAVYVRGAFEGVQSLAIITADPAEECVSMSVGATNVFGVTIAASAGALPTYVWTVDGVEVAGATTNRFAFGSDWGDHGRHVVRVVVSTTAGLSDSRQWTVTVHGEVHVDAAAGDDETATGAAERPYATLSAALAKSVEGDVLRVAPGTYAGGLVAPADQVCIGSTGGPESTVIDGGGANRCFDASSCPETVLDGFTLTNGWVDATTSCDYGAGALYGTLTNCVISGCLVEGAGGYGGGAAGAKLVDCVIRNCFAKAGGGGAYGATLTGCVIADCETDGQGGGVYDSTLVNCTVRGNRAKALRNIESEYAGGGAECQCVCTNTVLWDNVGPTGGTDNWEVCKYRYYDRRSRQYVTESHAPTFSWCCTIPFNAVSENSIAADPKFVTADDFADARVYEISPCLGAGWEGANIGAYRGAGVVKAFPPIDVATATGEEVSNAVASVCCVDPAVPAGIGTNGATYVAFQAWSTNGLKSTAVVLSTRAYDSFLVREIVAAPTLLGEGNETTVELTAPELASDGTCSMTMRLLDGENKVPLCSAKAVFAKHARVGVEPNALEPADAANVETTSIGGGRAVKLTITPPVTTLRYFIRFAIR